jgi:hypothetical protein
MLVKWKTGIDLSTRMIAIAIVAFVFTSYSNADDSDVSFPYQALVLNESAPVHSGPGKVHYATDKLKQGAAVEVHRHDPGGWCAVRPVKGSFSLVPSAAVEVIDDQVGEITESGTQAWVGTRLGAVQKPLWQVKLREGERIEILGEVSWPHPEGHSTIWYQIAPPAGEFRWMQLSDLQLPPSTRSPAVSLASDGAAARSNIRSLVELPGSQPDVIQRAQPIRTSLVAPSLDPATAGPVQDSSQIQLASASKPDNLNLGWRQSTRPIPNTETGFDRPPVIASNQSQQLPTARGTARSAVVGANALASVASTVHAISQNRPPADRYAALPSANVNQSYLSLGQNGSLQNLELRLTNEMVKDPSVWQIESILDGAIQIRDSARSANERLQASRLIDKCRNCLQVQSGFSGRLSGTNIGRPAVKGLGTVGSGLRADQQEVSFGTTYDAFGWLNELVRKQGELESEYVLQNRDGKITHHVIASPGLNLHRYVKSKVGIIGQRGYNHALNLDHVVADRVIVLDQGR